MRALFGLLAQLLHLALMLAAAPVLVGMMSWIEARLVGRPGASPLQPWRELRRLARKQRVIAEAASPLFLLAPAVSFVATSAAAAMVPSFARGLTSAPLADLLLIAGLLALARCVLALAALDVGTALGGLGASREISLAVFAEPALLMVFLVLALLAGTTNLDAQVGVLREGSIGSRVPLALAALAMVAIGLAEAGRNPLDPKAARSELAMVQSAMRLEYSGRDLALLDLGAALRLLVWLSLIAAVFLPIGVAEASAGPLGWLVGLVGWVVKLAILATFLALFEATTASPRLAAMPEFLGIALLLGLLAAMVLFVSQGLA